MRFSAQGGVIPSEARWCTGCAPAFSRKVLPAKEWRFLLALLAGVAHCDTALAQLGEKCVVTVLNRTIQASAATEWSLPNVPSTQGRVRARATCVNPDGTTTSGQSAYFAVVNNGVVKGPEIVFHNVEPIPVLLRFASANLLTLGSIGASFQLTTTAVYTDESTQNVTGAVSGTNYSSTNLEVATVSQDGLVTATGNGFALITARKDGALGMTRVLVSTGGDQDQDGIPDAYETANGLDASDPVDAYEDQDRDGLSALGEYQRGTGVHDPDTDGDQLEDGEEVIAGRDGYISDPLLLDTDGDELSDFLEVTLGSNPSDPNSHNYGAALADLRVTPAAIALVSNTVQAEEVGHKLAVIGTLIDGRTIDLTSAARGTQYTSSDLTICNFGLESGRVFGTAAGSCEITVKNGAFERVVSAIVTQFDPAPLSMLAMPGFANNVDVAGDYAYVAAGSAGIAVVDVHDRGSPWIAATLSLPGTAVDVRVDRGAALAYVAVANAGLAIVDVSDPELPVLLSSVDTPGDAQDVQWQGGRVYVADGAQGLTIIDVSNPEAPAVIGRLGGMGRVRGVDVRGDLAVLGGDSGVYVVDISLADHPDLLGSVGVSGVRDLDLEGDYVHVAAYDANAWVVLDITDPERPTTLSSGRDFYPFDVEVNAGLAFYADVLFVNGIPYVNVREPDNAIYQGFIDMRSFGDPNGTGIALDQHFAYVTGDFGVSEPYGVSGSTVLQIAQYRELADDEGIAPKVAIVGPPEGTTYVQGESISVGVDASDDVVVAGVQLLVDDAIVDSDLTAPFDLRVTAPVDYVGQLELIVRAMDVGGNVGEARRRVTVIADPLTTVVGRVVSPEGSPLTGVQLLCGTKPAVSGPNGELSVSGVSTMTSTIRCTALADAAGSALTGRSARVAPVRAGTTDVGVLVARSPATELVSVSATSQYSIRVTNDSQQQMTGAFALYYFDAVGGPRRGLDVDSGWGAVDLAPGQSIELAMPSPPYDSVEPGVYLLEFTGTLGLDAQAIFERELRMPSVVYACTQGPGTGMLEARVAGQLVGELAVDGEQDCKQMLVSASGPVDISFIADPGSFLVWQQTYPELCDFSTSCALPLSPQSTLSIGLSVGVEPLASLEFSTGARECESYYSCSGPFVPSSSTVSVVEVELLCDPNMYEPVLGDEQTLAGPLDTSIAPLPFSPARPAPRKHEYFVKVCDWCSLPNRRQVLRVAGLLHGFPVDGEAWFPLFEGQCDTVGPESCSYFQLDVGIHAGGAVVDEYWGSKSYEYCKFFEPAP